MPQIVVNQSMEDYVKYAKKKERKDMVVSILILIISILGIILLYYTLWQAVHI